MYRLFFIMEGWLNNFGGNRKIMEAIFITCLTDDLFIVGL